MGDRINEWKKEISKHKYLILMSIVFFIIANIANLFAGNYADRKGSAAVSDIILDNIPAINLMPIFLYGFTIVTAIIFIYPLFFKVKDTHIALSQLSLLVLVRSIFITLTHLKVPTDSILSNLPRAYDFFIFQNDMFFSGHTAIPFLGFLMFRKEKIRWFFLAATIIMAITVLLMHVHYSIDVFAAFFITYGSYKIGEWFFKKINHYSQ